MANYTKTTIGKENRTCCKAPVFCIRYFRNYLYLHSGERKFSGTFYSRGCRNRLIKSIYLQKCTALDKLRTVHFFFLQYLFTLKWMFRLTHHLALCQCLRQQSVTYFRTHHCLPHILCRFPFQRLMHMHHECEEYQQKPWCYAKYFSRQTSCTSGIPLNTQLTIPISLYPSLWYRFLAPAFRALVSMRKATQWCSFA